MRTLGPSSAALAQSSWSLLLMVLVIGPFLGRIASPYLSTIVEPDEQITITIVTHAMAFQKSIV